MSEFSWDPGNIQIRTRSLQHNLEPLVVSVTQLIHRVDRWMTICPPRGDLIHCKDDAEGQAFKNYTRYNALNVVWELKAKVMKTACLLPNWARGQALKNHT